MFLSLVTAGLFQIFCHNIFEHKSWYFEKCSHRNISKIWLNSKKYFSKNWCVVTTRISKQNVILFNKISLYWGNFFEQTKKFYEISMCGCRQNINSTKKSKKLYCLHSTKYLLSKYLSAKKWLLSKKRCCQLFQVLHLTLYPTSPPPAHISYY